MSNQLPAHLLALFQQHPEATSIGSSIESETFSKIRYSGSKWKLIKATGEEVAVPTAHLDVIVVGINEHKSHTVYAKAYDPKGEPESPVWSSDDGTPVPAEHETKVVSDYRRWAVIIADNPEGGVFELRVSAASITNGDKYATALRNFGAPIASMVTRLTFDAAFDYPKLVFTPVSYLNETQTAALGNVFKSGESQIAIALGKKTNTLALSAPIPTLNIPTLSSPQPAIVVPEATTQVKRARKAATPQAEVFAMPATPAASVVVNPPVADASLDSLLANIMGK